MSRLMFYEVYKSLFYSRNNRLDALKEKIDNVEKQLEYTQIKPSRVFHLMSTMNESDDVLKAAEYIQEIYELQKEYISELKK